MVIMPLLVNDLVSKVYDVLAFFRECILKGVDNKICSSSFPTIFWVRTTVYLFLKQLVITLFFWYIVLQGLLYLSLKIAFSYNVMETREKKLKRSAHSFL